MPREQQQVTEGQRLALFVIEMCDGTGVLPPPSSLIDSVIANGWAELSSPRGFVLTDAGFGVLHDATDA